MTTYVLCKTGSLAVFKVTARDQGHYKGLRGHLLHTVTSLVFFFMVLKNCKPALTGQLFKLVIHAGVCEIMQSESICSLFLLLSLLAVR